MPELLPLASGRRRSVFLDRDGVLIRSDLKDGKPIAVQEMERLDILPGVEQACRMLREAGFLLVMITNQPDVGRGLVPQRTVDEMNRHVQKVLGLDDVRVCYHGGTENCRCRKPKPGMIIDAGDALHIALDRSVVVGDRWSDIEAGRAVSCRTVYIAWGQSEKLTLAPDLTSPSLLDAVAWIIREAA